MSLPTSVNSSSFETFDPYSIYDKNIFAKIKKALQANLTSDIVFNPVLSALKNADPVFGINDTMISGLVKLWQGNTRKSNRKLIRTLVKYHVQHKSVDIETGLYMLMILSSLTIGKTTLNWYSQLQNPIRGKVIKSFIKNIPKSIAEKSDYFTNVGADILAEQNKACAYYFTELNQTLLAYLYLTCYYLKEDASYYLSRLKEAGYVWLDFSNVNTEEMYKQLFTFSIPYTPVFRRSPTINYVYQNFKLYEKVWRSTYQGICCELDEWFEYVNKHAKYYLEAFDSIDKKYK